MAKKKWNHRSRYIGQTAHFVEWVNKLGIEKTFLGRTIVYIEERLNLRKIAMLFLFSLALSFTLFYQFDFPQDYQIGKIAKSDLKAQFSFEMADSVTTEERRVEAEDRILFVFDYDENLFDKTSDRIYNSFGILRSYFRKFKWPKRGSRRLEKNKEFFQYKGEFEKALGVSVPNYIFDWLISKKFNIYIESRLILAHEKWSEQKFTDNLSKYIRHQDKIILRSIYNKNTNKNTDKSAENEITVSKNEIKDISLKKNFTLKSIAGWKKISKRDRKYTSKLAHLLLTANVTPNKQETERRRRLARESVLPVVIVIKNGQKIISTGEVVSSQQISLLNKIESLKNERKNHLIIFIAAILFVMMALVFFSYLRRFTLNRVKVDLKDVSVMGLVTFTVAMMTKVFLFITEAAFITNTGLDIPNQLFLYLAPVASGTMIIGLLITSGEVVWLFAMFLSVVLSFMVEMNFSFLIVTLIGSIAAARGVHGCKKRNDIYNAGVRIGLMNALSIILVLTIEGSVSNTNLSKELLWVVSAGFFGGVFSAFVTMMMIPLLESLFNYTTDVRLLELCNLNHPLLKDLLVKAPGTYHHSIVVGAMMEVSAEGIGANPLLGKVMGYYHDIGKTEHAEYFIENQRPGHNPHDQISAYMSKTILIAHVKDGAEMGLQHKLGKPIIDGILQHHGTTLIEYFYNRALESENEEIDHVKEEDFRYPGPRPQFRESGLLMIADSIEAAARSLAEPTPVRIQNLVKNIIHKKFLDGQLDECNLTLRDLSVIEKHCIHTLLSIYHQRIDYPQLGNKGSIGDKGAENIKEALKIKLKSL